jgi:hypothetical protein
VLQLTLARLFNFKNLNEPFCGDEIAHDVYTWAAGQKSSVMKLLSTNLYQHNTTAVDIIKLLAEVPMQLVVTTRNNLVDCCASLYYAEQVVDKFHYSRFETVEPVEFTVNMNFLNSWLAEHRRYHQVIADLKSHQIPYDIFDYDLYLNNVPQLILGKTVVQQNFNFVHADINYSNLCTNYQEVKTIIDTHVLGLT